MTRLSVTVVVIVAMMALVYAGMLLRSSGASLPPKEMPEVNRRQYGVGDKRRGKVDPSRWRVEPTVVVKDELPEMAALNKAYHARRRALRSQLAQQDNGYHPRGSTVHFIMGGDCTTYHMWQSAGLEHTFLKMVKRTGTTTHQFLTRVVIGCNEAPAPQQALLKAELPEAASLDLPLTGIFFAPSQRKIASSFDPYNHPAGLAYFTAHADITLEEYTVFLDNDAIFLNPLIPSQFINEQRTTRSTVVAQECDHIKMKDIAVKFRRGQPNCADCPSVEEWVSTFSLENPNNFPAEKIILPPYMLHSTMANNFTHQWRGLTDIMRQADTAFWGIEWISAMAAMAASGMNVEARSDLHVASWNQRGVWGGDTAEFVTESEPRLLHYGHRGVGWFEVGPVLDKPTILPQKEMENQKVVLDRWHFSKFRLPSDWPGGRNMPPVDLTQCKSPILQELPQDATLVSLGVDPAWVDKKGRLHEERNLRLMQLLIPAINKGLIALKQSHVVCPDPGPRNVDKRTRSTHPTYFVSKFDVVDKKSQS